MKRAYYSGASSSPPSSAEAPSEGYPTEGDSSRNVDPTVVGAYTFYMLVEAIVTVIEQASLSPDHDPNQFRDALLQLFITPTELAAAISTIPATDLSAYARIANPTFTGQPKAPTPPAGNNTTRLATTAFVRAALAALTIPGAFTPTKANLYAAVKEILHPGDQAAVTADDADKEIDIAFTPTKANLYAAVKEILHPGEQHGVSADDDEMEIDFAIPDYSVGVLADAATVQWDAAAHASAKLTLTADRALAISNTVEGQSYFLWVKQDATGGHALTLPADVDLGALTGVIDQDADAITFLGFTRVFNVLRLVAQRFDYGG